MKVNGSRLATGDQKLSDIVHVGAWLVFRWQLLQRDQRRCQCFRDNPFVVACDSLFWHSDRTPFCQTRDPGFQYLANAGSFTRHPTQRRRHSLGGNDAAIRSSRHQAILHLAGRRQLVSQPQSNHQKDNRDSQSSYRATPVSAFVGISHRRGQSRKRLMREIVALRLLIITSWAQKVTA
jgi:hypothetical protein